MAGPGSHSTFHQQSLDSFLPSGYSHENAHRFTRDWSLPGSLLQTEARPQGPGYSQTGPPNPQGALSPGPRAVPSLGPRRCRGFLNNAHLILSLSTPTGIFSCPWGVGHNFQGLCAISRIASRLLPDQHTLGSPVSSASLSLNECLPTPSRCTVPSLLRPPVALQETLLSLHFAPGKVFWTFFTATSSVPTCPSSSKLHGTGVKAGLFSVPLLARTASLHLVNRLCGSGIPLPFPLRTNSFPRTVFLLHCNA